MVVVRALAHWEYSMGVEPRYGKKGWSRNAKSHDY
jgi:hypothetical protein